MIQNKQSKSLEDVVIDRLEIIKDEIQKIVREEHEKTSKEIDVGSILVQDEIYESISKNKKIQKNLDNFSTEYISLLKSREEILTRYQGIMIAKLTEELGVPYDRKDIETKLIIRAKNKKSGEVKTRKVMTRKFLNEAEIRSELKDHPTRYMPIFKHKAKNLEDIELLSSQNYIAVYTKNHKSENKPLYEGYFRFKNSNRETVKVLLGILGSRTDKVESFHYDGIASIVVIGNKRIKKGKESQEKRIYDIADFVVEKSDPKSDKDSRKNYTIEYKNGIEKYTDNKINELDSEMKKILRTLNKEKREPNKKERAILLQGLPVKNCIEGHRVETRIMTRLWYEIAYEGPISHDTNFIKRRNFEMENILREQGLDRVFKKLHFDIATRINHAATINETPEYKIDIPKYNFDYNQN